MEFQVGQCVVYRNHKVCRLEAIETLKLTPEGEMQYYTLHPCFELSNEKIYVPFTEDAPMRPVMTGREARQYLRELKQLPIEAVCEFTAAKRESHYLQLLSNGDKTSHLYLFKELHDKEIQAHKKRKKMCIMDKRYQEIIEKILSEEFAIALDETPLEAKKLLYEALKC